MQAAGPEVQGLSLSGFGERMVTLCDGRPGLRSGLHVQVVEPDLGERQGSPLPPAATARQRGESDGRGIKGDGHSASDSQQSTPGSQPILDFIASDETLDRCDEIISADGWRLESYRRNPVFQNAHQYGDIIFTLGRALITEVRTWSSSTLSSLARHSGATAAPPSTYLFQRIQFATEANPMARIAYALYKGKFLNAVSVGFIPQRWEDGGGKKGRGEKCEVRELARDNAASPEVRHAGPRRRYLEQELLEVSAVGIPANPNALQLGLKAGAIQKSDLQELLDLLRSLCSSKPESPNIPSFQDSNIPFLHFRSHPAVPNTDAGASGVRSNEAQWLRLAREVRELMRKT
jgi:hypothetical protein